MRIEIDDIREEGLLLSFTEPPENFPELEQLAAADELRFVSPLQVSLRALRAGALIEVSGNVTTRYVTNCGRCLKVFQENLEASFDLTYTPELPEGDAASDEVELDAADLGMVQYAGDVIDLADALQEQVLLAIPLRPLCNEACRGLCPQCGIDRNIESCSCAEAGFDSRFAALKNLKLER